jgi:signal transduction histidine kinase
MKRKHYSVLIVEDSLTQGEHLNYILESNEYKPRIARNGVEALQMVAESIPDLIISDVMMPGMNGFELCQKIKNNTAYAKIPFILLTSLADPKDIIKGLEYGADNFIPKPFREDFLLSQIEYVLVNRDMREKSHIDAGMEILFNGEKYSISSNRVQIVDLLLSTYQNAVAKSNELIEANRELSKVHEELSVKNKLLEQANEEKNHFVGIVAHDLRNPLGIIMSFADIIREDLEGNVDEETMQSLGIIKNQAEHLLNLVTDLLGVTSIEAGTLTANKVKTDITELLDFSIMTNQYLANKKNIMIRKSLPPKSIQLMVDPNKMEQVFNNLLSNAVKFSHQNTHVTVTMTEQSHGVLFAIQDEGLGIPQKELQLLFKPFSKTSVKGTAGESSTGLGLFAVKKIIDAHFGRIWVESHVGIGSIFYFTLPFEPAARPEPLKTKQDTGDGYNWDDKLILIVEDIDSNYMFLAKSLLSTNVNLIWARNGAKAALICSTNPKVDLVLIDAREPNPELPEAVKHIRGICPDIIIIAQTNPTPDGQPDQCLSAGCDAVLQAPVLPDALIETIAGYFNKG